MECEYIRQCVVNAFNSAELILNTGHSFQFVESLEERRYVEFFLEDVCGIDLTVDAATIAQDTYLNLVERFRASPDLEHWYEIHGTETLTPLEWFVVVKEIEKKDEKPLYEGEIAGGNLSLYHVCEYEAIMDVQRHKMRNLKDLEDE